MPRKKSYQLDPEEVTPRAKELGIPTQRRLEFADPNTEGPQFRPIPEMELREKIHQAETVSAERRRFAFTIITAILSFAIAAIAAWNLTEQPTALDEALKARLYGKSANHSFIRNYTKRS